MVPAGFREDVHSSFDGNQRSYLSTGATVGSS